MSSERFSVDSFVFDPRPEYPFLVSSKRYRPKQTAKPENGLTLVLAHGTGFHKEQWEATIEELFGVVALKSGVAIRELWAIDCPNHGDSAVLNEKVLRWGYQERFGWEEYARTIHLFCTGQGTGLPSHEYFKDHTLVGIGHSMGAIAVLLSLTFTQPPPWKSIIMVDPMLLSEHFEKSTGPHFLLNGAQTRRDIWPSKEEAYKIFEGRSSYASWDRRVLKTFCKHGLRELPTLDYPDKTSGVTLSCNKIQEAACYRDRIGRIRAYNYLGAACVRLPVHAIYGGIDDYTPAECKEDVISNAAQGRFASVRRVADAGHLVVQTDPKGLAEAIHETLAEQLAVPVAYPSKSKL